MSTRKHIIFVCTGNRCRSPMAEGIARRVFGERGLDYTFASYGVLDLDGAPPTPQAQQVCRSAGIDISDHRAQPLTPDAAKDADLILVMERAHIDWIEENIGPDAAEKAFLITEYGRDGRGEEIPDPISQPEGFYEVVFGMLERELVRIADFERRSAG